MNTASSVAISLQASNICFAYVELFHITCHSTPGLEALSLPCPLVLFPLPQLIAQSVTLESYAPLILGNAPCCLVNLWCHQQQPRRRHPEQMDSNASEMKATRAADHSHVDSWWSWAHSKPAEKVTICCSAGNFGCLEISGTCWSLTIYPPFYSHPCLVWLWITPLPVSSKEQGTASPRCLVKLYLWHSECETGVYVYRSFVFTVFASLLK